MDGAAFLHRTRASIVQIESITGVLNLLTKGVKLSTIGNTWLTKGVNPHITAHHKPVSVLQQLEHFLPGPSKH